MPRLDITRQAAKISIESVRAGINAKSHKVGMKMNREPPQMRVSRENGKVELDMDEVWSNVGLKDYAELTSDAAAAACESAREGTKETVQTAALVGDIANKGATVGAAARNKLLEPQNPDPGHSTIPPKVHMYGDPGSFDIEWTRGDFSIDFQGGGKTDIYVEPQHSVDIQLSQRPYVRISVVEDSVRPVQGRKVSTSV